MPLALDYFRRVCSARRSESKEFSHQELIGILEIARDGQAAPLERGSALEQPGELAGLPDSGDPKPHICSAKIFARYAISLLRFAGRKRHIPDVGLSTDIQDIYDMLVIDSLITPDDDRLIRIKLGKPFQQVQEFLWVFLLPIDDDRSVGRNIDDNLTYVGLGLVSFRGSRHPDIQLVFAQREIPSNDEKDEDDQENVNHGRNHEPEYPGFCLSAKIHCTHI